MRKFIILFLILSYSGCLSKVEYLKSSHLKIDQTIDLNINSISFLDKRESISDRDLYIPPVSAPGEKDEVNPVLTDKHINFIKQGIYQHVTGKGQNVDFLVYIEKGAKKFRANLFSEIEIAEFRIRIEIYDNIHYPYYTSVSGEEVFEFESMDATPEFTEILYLKAMETSLNKCFKNLKIFIKREQEFNPIDNI